MTRPLDTTIHVMPKPRYLPLQIRAALRLRPAVLFLVRQVVIRKRVTRQYRLRRTGQVVTLRHRTPDVSGFLEVFVNGNYELPSSVRRCLQDCRRPLRAVDLGANIGLFGLSLLSQQPNTILTAVEPDPSNAAILNQTIISNGRSATWTVVRACAGNQDGTVRFRTGGFLQSQIAEDGEFTALRDVFPMLQDADLIKIDIEGAELALLSDPRFERLSARVLWLEFHPPHSEDEVLALVRRAGFRPGPITRRGGWGEFWATRSDVPSASD